MRLTHLATSLWAFGGLFLAGAAQAQDVTQPLDIIGAPKSGVMGWQPAATELARDIHWLDDMLLIVCAVITVLVTVLLLWVVVRYNRRANPTPKSFTHNSPLEVAWTIVPIVILVFIGAFSLPVLFKQQEIPAGDIHIKVTGNQWYWNYQYTDEDVQFDSYMIGAGEGNLNPDISAELASYGYSDAEFKLATDTAIIIPVNKIVVLELTGADVIHSWTIPAFGVKQDAVPGRLAHLWFAAEQEGIYFGQCSELCGKDHAFMPITVKVVSQDTYDAWLIEAKAQNPA